MRQLLIVLFLIILNSSFGQGEGIWIHPNRGQWDDPILYKVELNCGEMYLEKKGFTYALNDFKAQHTHHHSSSEKSISHTDSAKIIHGQIIRSVFNGSDWKGKVIEKEPSSHFRNYFLGNDPTKWKSAITSFHSVTLSNFYQGIDLVVDGKSEQLKYSFIIQPKTDITQIEYEIDGANSVLLDKEGNLHILNRLGEIIENKPIAWNVIDGEMKFVPIHFKVNKNKISFEFPKGFDENNVLVIDPTLTFSTFSGSTADNWGMTATPDRQGNLFAGGIVFTDGGVYPTTTGAYDVTINGGDDYAGFPPTHGFDIAITKFNSTGTNLLYSTYLGGIANEAPHSLVANSFGELFIMGVTASDDFPVTQNAFDATFNGGPTIYENELYYKGSDIFVAKLSVNGTILLGSTFVGGTGTDGINIGDLNYNYGDPFRGEIIDGKNGFVYISSTTQSTDFPTKNAAQSSLEGDQDAVVFRMDADLSALSWSTYFGGKGLETGNSVQLSSAGDLFIAGGTNSDDLPVSGGNDVSFNGGLADGYVSSFNASTGSLKKGTYMGLSEYDQVYFVQLDLNDEVYVFGQTESDWPISTGLYGNANSGQFIRKYTNDLATIVWTTMIGAGTGFPEISPTAFLVSDCYDIYFSGWGGKVNVENSNKARHSTTLGFPVTPDALQPNTLGDNFYIAVLEKNATSLKYGSFMGGIGTSLNHVDGGTSRFDKSGRIYHAVCGACGGKPNGFTTTSGVYSPTNQSGNCNLAAFKIQLTKFGPTIGTADTILCMPDPLIFKGNVTNGNSFDWNFGDNATSNDTNPVHNYALPGKYIIQLIVKDTVNCLTIDTILFKVRVSDFKIGVQPTITICPGIPYKLEAFGGATYSWLPDQFLDDSAIPTPLATVESTTLFKVAISDFCGSDTLDLILPVFPTPHTISNDTSICIGGNMPLLVTGGGSYQWSPSNSLTNSTSANPIATPTETVTYLIDITTVNNCLLKDSTTITVFKFPPIPTLIDSVRMCITFPETISSGGGESYTWSPNYAISSLIGNSVTVNPANDTTYYCFATNACGTVIDSIFVDVIIPVVKSSNDTIVCPNNLIKLSASGAKSYEWFNGIRKIDSLSSSILLIPKEMETYTVIGTDEYGCMDTATTKIDVFPKASVRVNEDVYAMVGDLVQLSITSNSPGTYSWSPSENLNCVQCPNPIANPDKTTNYTLTYTDLNSCKASDGVKIIYDPILYVPNTFTPSRQLNTIFKAVGGNIHDFEMLIFNRWGELIFTSNSFDEGWNGTYKGEDSMMGTYTWKIIYADLNNKRIELVGHVNLIR